MNRSVCLLAAWLAAFTVGADGQEPPAEPAVTTEQLSPDLHILFGAGGGQASGNVLALLGPQGTLVIDTGYPQFVPLYRDNVARLGGKPITYAINTHWHDDHSEGNKILGPDRVLIVAHTNAREMLLRDNKINVVRTILDQPAFPPAALPVVTFDNRMELYFGDERIELMHVAPAHTAGDVVVILRNRNVAHTGDVFLPAAYPFSDVDNGGSFDGEIEFVTRLLVELDRNTMIVPGHGRVASYDDLVAYVEMLKAVRGRIAALVASGATLEQVVAAEPTKEWDAKYGNPRTYFLNRSYKSLGGR
jgi:glyoxylase-like metal-dependent hydrolase (beta-lactamase superfamily II)